MKDGDVDPRREGNFGSRQARANKLREGDRSLRPGGQGSPNGRCFFLGGGSNICLADRNWRERHNSCRFRSDGLSPAGGRPLPCRGRPRQLVAVTAQMKRSFSDNGRQPTAEELEIAERVRAAVRSCMAYLATTEPARAQIVATHA